MAFPYDAPHQFEPLLPSLARREPLFANAHDLAIAASALAGRPIATELRGLLRAMNSYYTDRIEGQHARPYEIEQALRRDFSKEAQLAARQRLAIAHIELELEARYAGEGGRGEAALWPCCSQRHPSCPLCAPSSRGSDDQRRNGDRSCSVQEPRGQRGGGTLAPAAASAPAFVGR